MNKFLFDCSVCPTRCDGISKGIYNFISDVEYSENKENQIIDLINSFDGFHAQKCELEGYPDIEVYHIQSNKRFFVEIKAQRRTFMSVKRILPDGGLEPSETLALNLSDLLRYFDIQKEENVPIFILWCLENRPCIVPDGETYFYYQDTRVLEDIYKSILDKRRFRRESGRGDYVNGQHKGVVVNYHFSLNELDELIIEELLRRGIEE